MSGQSASPKVNGQGAPRPAASNGHEGLISETELIYGEKIGSGGFGIVQRGQYKGRVVAMKTMTIGEDKKMDKAQLILSFAGEAKRMRQFSHPNIVTFIGYVLKRYSLVMEFMELGNLKKYIENRKPAIPWPDRFNFAVDICAGMFYLHSKVTPDGQKKPDLFHQDLKTSNVLLRNIDGRITAKICDFGLSVLRERSNNNGADSILSTGSGLHSFVNYNGGTLDYLAPELLMGNATGSGKKVRMRRIGRGESSKLISLPPHPVHKSLRCILLWSCSLRDIHSNFTACIYRTSEQTQQECNTQFLLRFSHELYKSESCISTIV